jgi:hypothetical protein
MVRFAVIEAENGDRQSYVYNSFYYLLLVEDVNLFVTRINSCHSCHDNKIIV